MFDLSTLPFNVHGFFRSHLLRLFFAGLSIGIVACANEKNIVKRSISTPDENPSERPTGSTAPTDISLSSLSISEHLEANSEVGTLSGTDIDSGSLTYSLVAGTGDTDNGSFNISGNSLRATSTLDFETKASYSVRVRVSDGSLSFEKAFTITVLDIADPETGIVCGNTHCLEIRSDRTLWAWGLGSDGQLGTNSLVSISTPTQIAAGSFWLKAVPGNRHTLAIKSDGTLWSWGFNGSGQLGLGDTSSRMVPTQIGGSTWKDVAGHQNFSVGIQSDGSLWAWGVNGAYQLGLNHTTNQTTPTRVGIATDWLILPKGANSLQSLAIKTDGTLWGWGDSNYGEVGIGVTTNVQEPTQVGSATWKMAATGNIFSVGIQSDGTLWAWGPQRNGRLGDGVISTTKITTPKQIDASTDWLHVVVGTGHTLALKGDANTKALYAWGSNANGQIGNNTQVDLATPTQIVGNWARIAAAGSTSLAQKSDGSWWAWGSDTSGVFGNGAALGSAPTQIGTDNNWQSVLAGNRTSTTKWNFSFGIRNDGTLWAWGYNLEGELGVGDTANRTTPTQVAPAAWSSLALNKIEVGLWHSLAIMNDGSLWAWGYNGVGQLGVGDTTQRTAPTKVGTDSTWTAISAAVHSAGIKSDGTLWMWGYNGGGQLGVGDTANKTTPTQETSLSTAWTDVSVGGGHTLALQNDGNGGKTLWAWGINSAGQVGNGTTTTQTSPIQIGTDTNWAKVYATSNASFAIKSDGTLWAWGQGSLAGLGTLQDYTTPTQVGTATTWTSVFSAVFATQSNGSVWGWGVNEFGILPGISGSHFAPTEVFATSPYTSLATSFTHALGVKSDGTLWGWGVNTVGELGSAPTAPVLVPTQVRAP